MLRDLTHNSCVFQKYGREINEEKENETVTPIDKSKSTIESTERRSPNEITDWLDFKQEVQKWQLESNKNIINPYLGHQPIYFLDGHALKNIVGEPDFVIADNNIKLLIPYLAFKNRYAPFLKKPIMIADNVDEESYSSDKEQNGDIDFKYRI
ncbi:hypothetical protein RhiirA5_432427 [Rhizophagus irregularis]|uniref:Uncharacterized protein n=1 Tax=Rhizophagus irregularis TaxID=588596 RepID=A0A2N0NTC9_9GLOM|nr:hypothetical protein RhiirA5_432427 [Rhizophagus irregularis]